MIYFPQQKLVEQEIMSLTSHVQRIDAHGIL